MTQLKYNDLSDRLQAQARARFVDAGSGRDNYFYELDFCGNILCRNREHPEPGDYPDEGLWD